MRTCAFPVALVTVLALVAPALAQNSSPGPAPDTNASSRPADGRTATTTWTTSDAARPASTTATTGTTGTAPAGARTTLSPDYRLAPGDKLRVEVYKDDQLSQSLQVRPDGKITLPLIGDVPAAGLMPTELRDHIATALKEYVTNPVVTVIVVETVPPSVFVMGEVNKPGAIAMQGPLTIMQALAMAGGFKDFANTKKIRILRKTPRGVQTLSFNYKDAAKGEGELVMLVSGDTVIVP